MGESQSTSLPTPKFTIQRGWCIEGRIFGALLVSTDSTEICSPDVLTFPLAHEFDPDRFLDDRVEHYLTPNPSIFFPFSAGPRTCIGQQFAYNEASTVIAHIAQAFKKIRLDMDSNPEAKPPADWANGDGRKAKEKIWVRSHIVTYAKGGVWVKMEEADPE